jgi:HPr kinase/phosphorylase
MALIHANCVAIAAMGVLIRGPSGSGKSDLALQLIDGGAELVADDYCETSVKDGRLFVEAPTNIAGKMELRGHGIVSLPFRPSARVELVVDLMPEKDIERLPDTNTCIIDGVTIRHLAVDAFSASAAAKVRLVIGRTP